MLRSKVVPAAVAQLQPLGRLAGTKQLQLAIALPLRNQAALSNLLQQISDPTTPNYRHYLTPEEFTAQFGPTPQDYQALIVFARSNGLTVTGTHPNRTLLDVSGAVTDIEKVFHLAMRVYPHPKEARTFFAPDAEPTVDVAVPVLGVSGLDDFSPPKPANLRIKPANLAANATPNFGSGPKGSYRGNDFRAAYAPGVSLTGAGQSVGLVQFSGYVLGDITNYAAQTGLPNVPLVNVFLDGYDGTPDANNVEVALDIEMAMAMAPGLSNIIVYSAGPFGIPNDVLNRMATDNLAKQLSCSWTWSPFDPAAEQIFQQFAAQGQSFFQASGDGDAYVGGVAKPADEPLATVVGGTTLFTSAAGGPLTAETAWNWGGGFGSGGGISTSYLIPLWQQGINMTANHGSTSLRNIPDVAMTADNIWVAYHDTDTNGNFVSTNNIFGGTSAATPLWAAFMALVNQRAAQAGQPPVGFANPAIYAIAKSTNYTAAFNDITSGDNTSPSSPTNFYAVPGYDLCTGWGTPTGQFLISALAIPDVMGVLPSTGFTAEGPIGGPFNVSNQNFVLTNTSAAPLDWSVTSIPSWLNVSPVSGTLPASTSVTVTVTLGFGSSNLVAGIYATNLVFANLTSGFSQQRQFRLLVDSLVQNGGFETGDFTGWTLNGTGGNFNFVDYGSAIIPHSGSYDAALGELGAEATLSQAVPTASGQKYLISFWLNSSGNPFYPFTTTPNEFKTVWNGVTLMNATNFGQFGWINLQFIVKAVGPSTVLQFGVRDDNWYLGLDDVSVTPILPPTMIVQPADLTVSARSNAVFTGAASGSPPMYYSWRKNGTNLVNGGRISGVTGNVLAIASARFGDTGNYSLVVTNAYGSVTSSVAVLNVNLNGSGVTLNSSANPSGFRDAVQFTASVTPTNATGTMQFLTNGVVLGTQTLFGGQSIITNAALPRGTNLLTAIYSGDSSNLPTTNSLVQIVTNHPPAAATAFYARNAGSPLNISLADLMTYWSDADGDTLSLAGLSVSTNGITITNNAGTLAYINSNNVADQFTATISDGWGGTNFQTINIGIAPPANAIPNITGVAANSDGSFHLNLTGASGFTYILETSTNLFPPISWQPIATNTMGTNGVWPFTDAQAASFAQRFYRLKLVP